MDDYFDPAQSRMQNQDASILAENLCSLAAWYNPARCKPKLKWKNNLIPTPLQLIQEYIRWILNQSWIDNHSASMYQSKSKLFSQFLEKSQSEAGIDYFTGGRR